MSANFFGFSTDAFERFIRAVASCTLGPGVTMFGNGPDRGRESTFRGKVPFPFPPTDCWEGYGVIQAKCKEKPESTEKEQGWALAYLKRELERFVRSKKRSPKPEYYVFAVNVELSSSSGGAKDR